MYLEQNGNQTAQLKPNPNGTEEFGSNQLHVKIEILEKWIETKKKRTIDAACPQLFFFSWSWVNAYFHPVYDW